MAFHWMFLIACLAQYVPTYIKGHHPLLLMEQTQLLVAKFK